MNKHYPHLRGRRLLRDQSGAALIEFTLLAPLLLSLVLGIAEFGRFLYQYQMVIEGLRDAGRYLARLDPNDVANQTSAANLATTGTIDGTGVARVDGWVASDIEFTVTPIDNTAGTYRGPLEPAGIEVVEVSTTFDYADVGFLSALGLDPISIAAAHEQRVILE
jgi:Flp pilus assembly protein TadG